MPKRTATSELDNPPKKRKLTTSENLQELANDLHPRADSYKVTTNVANTSSVCWDWVFNGAPVASFEDLRVLTCNYFNNSNTKLEKITPKNGQIAKGLRDARDKWVLSKFGPNDYKEACEEVVKACMKLSGLRINHASPLRIKYYYDTKAVFFQHIEFDYQKGQYGMTITKGMGEKLKAFNGNSIVPGNPPSAMIGLDISSLKQSHLKCIEDLLKNAI